MDQRTERPSFSPMDWDPLFVCIVLGGGAVVYVLEWSALYRLVGGAVACQMLGVVAVDQWRSGGRGDESARETPESIPANSVSAARADVPLWWILIIGVMSIGYGAGAWAFGRIFGFLTGSAAVLGVVGSVSILSLHRRVKNGLQLFARQGEEPPDWWEFVFAFVFIVVLSSLYLVVTYKAASPWGYFVIFGCMGILFLVRAYLDAD